MSRYIYNDYTGGLIDEDLSLRSDLEDYSKSLLIADNVTPLITGGLTKRLGTVTFNRHTTYKNMFTFNQSLVFFDEVNVYAGNQSFNHIFTNVNNLRFVTTKDRAFILQRGQTQDPFIPIFELRYFKDSNDYTFNQLIFNHPALESNLTARSPGTKLTLDKITGDNVVATANRYSLFDKTISYFIDDVFIIEKTEGTTLVQEHHTYEVITNISRTSFKVITSTVTGVNPVNEDYEEIATDAYQRTLVSIYPTYDPIITYNLDDTVYYRGSYYKSLITANTNPITNTASWEQMLPTDDEQDDVFLLEDVGKYLTINQGVMLIESILTKDGQPATIDTVNTKAKGRMVVDAVAKEANKDSWFIKTSILTDITDMTIIQQRLVLSTKDTVYFSKVADYSNLLQSSVTLTADAFSVAINSNLTTEIKYITPWRNGIIAHTNRSEFYVYSESLLSALSIKAEESVYFSISECEPVQVQGDVLYIAENRLRRISFVRERGGLVSESLSNQVQLVDPIKKIITINNLVYLLADNYMYCLLYDKENNIIAFSKHIHKSPILTICQIDTSLYYLTSNKILKSDKVYTDETEYDLVNKEIGMTAYNTYTYTVEQEDSDRCGYTYPVNIKTTNLDFSLLAKSNTKIDQVQRITDIVVHLKDSSHLVINNQDMEIPNNTTGTILKYEDQLTTDHHSYNDPDKYRIRLSSISPFNLYIKGVSINGR